MILFGPARLKIVRDVQLVIDMNRFLEIIEPEI